MRPNWIVAATVLSILSSPSVWANRSEHSEILPANLSSCGDALVQSEASASAAEGTEINEGVDSFQAETVDVRSNILTETDRSKVQLAIEQAQAICWI